MKKMAEKQTKRGEKNQNGENIEYGKSAFDSHVHRHAVPTEGKKLPKNTKIILVCAAVILIIIIAYIGLNYFYSYDIVHPGETTFNPL